MCWRHSFVSKASMALRFLLILMMFTATRGQASTAISPVAVCKDLQYGTSNFTVKDLEGDFAVRMEIVAQETNRITNIRMFYSQPKNQIRLQMLDSGARSDVYFYFSENEILTFDYSKGRGSCSVNPDLANAPDTFIVGGSKDKQIKEPMAVLHLIGQSGFGTDIKLQKLAATKIREMDVDAYYSCQKLSFGGMEAIVNVTHYFSSKSWSRPDPPVVPVSIEIHGSAVVHNQLVNIDHFYNFFDFQSGVDPFIFETPPGIMCEGRNVDNLPKFPNLPTYIKFNGEIVDPSTPHVNYIEEIYDSDDDFVVVRTQGTNDDGTMGGMNHFTYIRDYPSGLSYAIENTNGRCSTQNISAATPLPLDYIDANGKAQEITPDQLFFTKNTKFVYLGERIVRGVTTETWVAKTNIPAFPNEEVTVEWYFAKPEVTSWNSGSDYYQKGKYRMPMLLRVWHNDVDSTHLDMNIYHVDYTNIMYGVLDIRSCYQNKQSNFFQLILNGAKELVTNTNIEQFKWATVFNIADVAGVRWIRIADLHVYYDNNDAVIEFELLDAPAYASDVSVPIPAVSLQNATQKLQNAVTSGKMSINVWDSSTNTLSKPIPVSSNIKILANTAVPDTKVDNGYSAGSMAGLGIAMVIIGGAGGGIGAHFFIK